MRKVFPALVVLVCLCAACSKRMQVRRDGEVQMRDVSGLAAAVSERGAREIPCPESALVLEDLGSGGYRIEGCGVRIVYACAYDVCISNSRESTLAVAESQPRSSRPRDPAREWTDEDVRMLLARLHDDVLACLPGETASQRIQLELARTGRVSRTAAARLPAPIAACIDARLERETMGREVRQSRRVLLEFRRGASPSGQDVAAENPPPSAPPPSPAASPEAAARAAINSRSPAILACVDADALSMQVSWSSEGGLDALLRGERQGTPEEACVRAIVQELSIPRPGAPGALIHALQR